VLHLTGLTCSAPCVALWRHRFPPAAFRSRLTSTKPSSGRTRGSLGDEAVCSVPRRRGRGGGEPPRGPGRGRLVVPAAVRGDAAEPVRERVRGEGRADPVLLRQAQVPRAQLPVPLQGRRQPEAPVRRQAQAPGVHRVQAARPQLQVARPWRESNRRSCAQTCRRVIRLYRINELYMVLDCSLSSFLPFFMEVSLLLTIY
jgi:hypothetical protein